MKITFAVTGVIAFAAIAAFHSTVHAQQTSQAPTRTVLDGVFTEEQAKRGDPLYSQYCASCHGPTLMGGEMAPPLVGGEFASNWNDLTVGDLFERIRVSMPQNDPGSLSRQQVADILAFILSVNKYPAGQTEVARETEALKQIKLVPAKQP